MQRIEVYTEDGIKEVIVQRAKGYGLPVSTFLRMAGLNFEIPGVQTLQARTPSNQKTGDQSETG